MTVDLSLDYLTKLRERLRKAGILHAELAREMKVNPEQVSRWLNRGEDPRVSTVVAIEQAIVRIQKKAGSNGR